MPSTALTDLFENGIRRFGGDALKSFKDFDISYLFIGGAGILLAILVVDLIGYLYAAYEGNAVQYTPYSRSLAVMASDAWNNRHQNYLGDVYDPYARARSLEPLTEVLDSLSSAVQKWGNDSDSHQRLAADRSFVFSN